MSRAIAALAILLALAPEAHAQTVERLKHVYETLFMGTVRLSLEPIAPTAGVYAGLGFKPTKDWHTPTRITTLQARVSVSTNKYWAVDGSVAWQGMNLWRIEPYVRLRSMNRLNFFGLGPESEIENRTNYAMLERRLGAYGYVRPIGWLAVGGRGEVLWPRTGRGQDPDSPSIEAVFPPAGRPGFNEDTNYVYIGGFVNLNYPYVRSERPRRGGDYQVAIGRFQDVSDTLHSFTRLEIEGAERFPIYGVDRLLTVHARISSDVASSGHSVPYYLMDTLGGADNLRGFKEAIIGGDETTSTLRPFESFRFRDHATALFQVEFRQRVKWQVFLSLFVDAGTVATDLGKLGAERWRRGVGIGLSVFKVNALAVRAEFSLWGGEGRPFYFTPGRGLGF